VPLKKVIINMPTYEYRCDACGHELEELQSFSAVPLKKCPKCKKNKLERLISGGGGFIFKGGGFYETDYRDSSYKDAEKKDSGTSDKKEGGEAKKTETSETKKPKKEKKPESPKKKD